MRSSRDCQCYSNVTRVLTVVCGRHPHEKLQNLGVALLATGLLVIGLRLKNYFKHLFSVLMCRCFCSELVMGRWGRMQVTALFVEPPNLRRTQKVSTFAGRRLVEVVVFATAVVSGPSAQSPGTPSPKLHISIQVYTLQTPPHTSPSPSLLGKQCSAEALATIPEVAHDSFQSCPQFWELLAFQVAP